MNVRKKERDLSPRAHDLIVAQQAGKPGIHSRGIVSSDDRRCNALAISGRRRSVGSVGNERGNTKIGETLVRLSVFIAVLHRRSTSTPPPDQSETGHGRL